jgi:hypothetical protein
MILCNVSELFGSKFAHHLPDIGRDGVTRLHFDKITRDDFYGWDSDGLSISDGGGSGRRKRSQRVHCLFSIELLHETDNYVEQDDGSYYTTFDPRLNCETDGHGSDENLLELEFVLHSIARNLPMSWRLRPGGGESCQARHLHLHQDHCFRASQVSTSLPK